MIRNACTDARITTFVRAAVAGSAAPANCRARMLLIVDRCLVLNEVSVHDDVILRGERSEADG
jgi:hypothetical protein